MTASDQPNVLLITSDQQHWNTLGVLNPALRTPCLDHLASEGTLFERAYCPNPTCTPTRASILTGQYPSQHGAYSLGTKLDERHPTMNDVWHAAGYRTGLVGKAHFQPLRGTDEFPSLEAYPVLQNLDFWRHYSGPFYGFDDFDLARNHTDEAHIGQHYALWMEQQGFTQWRDCFAPPTGRTPAQKHRWNIPEEFHYNTWIAERTNHRLASYRDKQQPFFLWASFFDPHPSYLVPSPWDKLYDPQTVEVPKVCPGEHDRNPPFHRLSQDPHPDFAQYGIAGRWMHGVNSHVHREEDLRRDIAVYYGMVSCLDKYVGRILDRLETLGLADNTLVVFTSDHGHYFGHHGLTAKGPFHYEDGIRVPFIVRWPGRVPAGLRSQALQSLVDLPVSFLAAAGRPVPRWMTGLDQTAVWTGQSPAARHCCVVENNHEPGMAELKTYVDQRYKITVYRAFEDGEMYDLEEDPGEVRNLWYEQSAAGLKCTLLQRFMQAEMAKEVLPMPRIAPA